MNKYLYIVIILFISCNQNNVSKSVELTVSLDTNYTTIGTPVSYSIYIKSPKDKIIEFPDWILEDPIEIRSKFFDNSKHFSFWGSNQKPSVEIELVFWDTGSVVLPGYTIEVLNSDSSFSYDMTSDSMIINVISITEQDPAFLQSGGQIMPIKDPVPVKTPLPWRSIFLTSLMLSIIIGIFILSKKRVQAKVDYMNRQVYLDGPDIVALDKLEKLLALELVDKDNVKEFYVQLSFILREYTENSLFIRTLEMTTEQICTHRNLFPYPDNCIDSYLDILSTADMAKYAKHYNNIDQCKSDLNHSRNFVQDTVQFWKPSFSIS